MWFSQKNAPTFELMSVKQSCVSIVTALTMPLLCVMAKWHLKWRSEGSYVTALQNISHDTLSTLAQLIVIIQ